MYQKLKQRSIRSQYILFVIILLIILMISYITTDLLAKRIIKKNAIQASEKIVLQVEDKISTFYDDINKISVGLIYSPTINAYINNEDILERILNKKDVDLVLTNTFSIKENIVGIELYSNDMMCLAKMGQDAKALGSLNISRVQNLIYYSEVTLLESSNSKMYTILIPIYNLAQSSKKSVKGYCVFVMNTKNFNQILQNSLLTKNSTMALIDQNNNIIAEEGFPLNYQELSTANRSQYFFKQANLNDTGWKIVSVIPKSELYSDMDFLMRVNFFVYIVIAGILFLFLSMFFIGILRPVNELIIFMGAYPKHGKNVRMKNKYYNEMGILVTSLNQMLDDIDKLSEEIQTSQKRIYDMDISKKQMEITSYRNQVNPHFLYNTFECIRAMAFYYKANEIAEITEALSKMFRYTVKGDNITTIGEEISIICEYAKIIDYRFMGRIKIKIEMADNVADKKIIKMLLQPIVENAVFHGLEKVVEGGVIDIIVKRLEDMRFQFTIHDNGFGIAEDKLHEIHYFIECYDQRNEEANLKQGIGLTNIYRRLRLFYSDKVEFNIRSKTNIGTEVVIIIPLLSKEMED